MNWWWILLICLSALWVLPMYGAHRAQAPTAFFVAVAALWTVVFVFAEALYDWGTSLARKLGHSRLADFRDRLKPTVLPPARIALLLMAAISAVFAVL
jgi:UPF0716 family protein affecting phage T7 exclusion